MKHAQSPGRRALQAAAGAATAAGQAAQAALDAEEAIEPGREPPKALTEADRELTDATEQLPEGALFSAWKFLDNGERAWCAEGAVADFSPAAIGEVHGGGKYIVYFRKPGPVGKHVPAGTRRFQVSKSIRPRNELPAAAPAAGPGGDLSAKFFENYARMVEQTAQSAINSANMLQTMQAAVMKAALESRPADSTGNMVELLKVLGPIFAPLLARTAPTGGLTPEFLLQLVDRQAKSGDPTHQLKTTLGLVAQMRELAGDGDGAAPPWMSMVEKGLDLINAAIEKSRTERLAPGAPEPAPTPTREDPVARPESPRHPFLQALEPFMPMLLRNASRYSPPETYASMILDEVAPGYHEALLQFLQTPGTLDLIGQTWPDVVPVRPWFGELIQATVAQLTEPDEDTGGPEQ